MFSEVEELVEASPAGTHALKGFDLPVGVYTVAGVREPTQVDR